MKQKPMELVGYEIVSAVCQFAATCLREADAEYAKARRVVSFYSDIIEKLKKVPTVEVVIHGEKITLTRRDAETQSQFAIITQRIARTRFEDCEAAYEAAVKARQHAHEILVNHRIRVISYGANGALQVVVRVGDQSVTRHLRRTRDGYTGYAWDKSAVVTWRTNTFGLQTNAHDTELLAA